MKTTTTMFKWYGHVFRKDENDWVKMHGLQSAWPRPRD